MRVLVTVGSERGGTVGLGEMVAEDLRAEGFEVDLRPPREVRRLDGYDAVALFIGSSRTRLVATPSQMGQ